MDRPRHDHTLLIFCAALFLFNSPLTSWWSGLRLPWYALFVLWMLIIVLVAMNQWRGTDRGD